MNNDFEKAFETFLAGCNKIVEDANLCRETKVVIRGGRKFLALDRSELGRYNGEMKWTTTSVHCFIATEDGHSKYMGHYKAGDVLKPASYKKPARHARGNIFDANNGLAAMSWTGPAYIC